MARIASRAVAGYYPTPTHLLSPIAAMVTPAVGDHRDAWMDPCAGEGEALARLIETHYPVVPGEYGDGRHVRAYAIELEETRHWKTRSALEKLQIRNWGVQVLHGDATRATVDRNPDSTHNPGLTGLYLNPPYDQDPVFRRLEERFLRKFADALMPYGVLLFLIPVGALPASAETLARKFQQVEVFRFPDPDYDVFKQVVVRAVRRNRDLPGPARDVLDRLTAAHASPLDLPTLDVAALSPVTLPVPPHKGRQWGREGFAPGDAGIDVSIAPLDLANVFALYRPWHHTDRAGRPRAIPNVHPKDALAGFQRVYPSAVPPKPGHIAAALAAGAFNGECLTPDNTLDGASAILVKGVFRRQWRTVEEKTTKEGEKTGEVQVEEPRLEVTALDLASGAVHTLAQSPEPSGATNPAQMTTGDLLTVYSGSLLRVLRAHCPPDYDPADPAGHFPLVQTGRPLYTAQAHAARAVVVQLGGPGAPLARRRGKYAVLLGEIGCGKSATSLVAARTTGARRVLVLCPPHLLTGWEREVQVVWPEARVVVLRDISDVERLAADTSDRPVVALLTRETAKLGHAYEGVSRCAHCGAVPPFTPDMLAAKRARCTAVHATPLSPGGGLGIALAQILAGHDAIATPATVGFRRRVSRTTEGALLAALRRAVAWAEGRPELPEDDARAVGALVFAAGDEEDRVAVAALLAAKGQPTVAGRVLSTAPTTTPGWTEALARIRGEAAEGAYTDGAIAARRARIASRSAFDGVHEDHEWGATRVEVTRPDDGSAPMVSCDGRALGTPAWADEALGLLLGGGKVRHDECGAELFQAAARPLVAASPVDDLDRFVRASDADETTRPRRYPLATYIARKHPGLVDILLMDECFVAGTLVSGRPIEEIAVGDVVESFDEETQRVVARRVTRLWRKPPTSLVRVVYDDGRSFVCTPNHPVYANGTWTPSALLTPGTHVRVLAHGVGEDVRGVRRANAPAAEANGPGQDLLQPPVLREERREDAPTPAVEVSRPPEDGGLGIARVARVEVLERGGDGRYGGVCPDGVVYNLEVEGTHTYFAEGVLVHNCHEYGGEGSAQGRAAHRLTSTRVPVVLLTGSLVNGYARHLFANLWNLDPAFRAAFPREGAGRFAVQYGYRRRFVAEGDNPTDDVTYGAVTDRKDRSSTRDLGEAPGVQPLAVLEWVIPRAATLHKSDLDTGIPELDVQRVVIEPDEDVLAAHTAMLSALVTRIKRDSFSELSGALWGQLAEAPSHLDRCTSDTGNRPDGSWEVRYPEHRGVTNPLVHRVAPFDATRVLPKERWMLDTVAAELAAGRPCIVLAWHTDLFPRYARLLKEHLGRAPAVLEADRVPPAKRQLWIERVLDKGAQVLITNPVAVQTGLNCLTTFATELWMQNPGCNAIVFRQACGRVDRIGQKQAPRALCPIYGGTAQDALHRLLLQKVAVSQSVDGQDARSALQATGVGETAAISSLSVGKVLFDLLDRRGDLRAAF